MTLLGVREWTSGDGWPVHRREEWTISGGEIDPTWWRDADVREGVAGWKPSSRYTLYVVDDEVDPRLASYGGAVWPTAWPQLFRAIRIGIEITDAGLKFRNAALHGAFDIYADVGLLP